MKYEYVIQSLIDKKVDEREWEWLLGDAVGELVKEYGRGIISKAASDLGYRYEYVRQRVVLAKAFSKEYRYPDVDFSKYRAAYNKANSLGVEPVEILKQVLESDMSLAEIAAIGKEKANKAKLNKTCEWCNSKITVTADGGLAGTRIHCPVCAEDGQIHLVGVLESDD